LYYLITRYYDPNTGRFLNADENNFYGYLTADAAAAAFIAAVYNASQYSRLEMWAFIYELNGRYFYSTPVVGSPHDTSPVQFDAMLPFLPPGAKPQGIVHTHVNQTGLSGSDRGFLDQEGMSDLFGPTFWVAGENGVLWRSDQIRAVFDGAPVWDIYSLAPLTASQMDHLDRYSYRWYDHFVNGECPRIGEGINCHPGLRP